MVSELSISDCYEGTKIVKPTCVISKVDKDKAINRIANQAEIEEWDEWEIREAVRMVMEEGAYSETRPAFFMRQHRTGIVIAVGAGMDVSVGDVVLFAFSRSVKWHSFWRDCLGIAAQHKVCFTDGKSFAINVPADSEIHICPENAIPGSLPYSLKELENVA